VTQLLADLDRPRAPREEFARALHDELLGDELVMPPTSLPAPSALRHHADSADDHAPPLAVLEAAPRPRPRSVGRRRWFAAVAATVALLAGVGIWSAIGGDDAPRVAARPPNIKAVCTRFNRTAFAEVPRSRLLGPDNAPLFTDAPTARRLVTTLRGALATMIDDFKANGIADADVTSALRLAIGDADTALGSVEAGRVNSIGAEVAGVEFALLQVERALAADGIVGCL
jgi:hypothetical protein